MTYRQRYDAAEAEKFYDDYAEREWYRLESDAAGRMYFHVHLHYLLRYVQPGHEVLEIGAGPGRFTIPIAERGAFVTVADISQAQLDLNRTRVNDSDHISQVRNWCKCDAVDLGVFPDEAFDTAVAFGGILSYTMEQDEQALAELLRVTKPGGHVLLSVMSKWGTARSALGGILGFVDKLGVGALTQPLESGNVTQDVGAHHLFHLYSSDELRKMFLAFTCELELLSASNFLSIQNNDVLKDRWNHPTVWNALVDQEITASAQPGVVDAGTHIIAVLRKL